MSVGRSCFYAVIERQKQENADFGAKVKITTRHQATDFLIIIEDNGIGISTSVREKIFEPFYTTKPTGEGNTGLGLYISYDIVVNKHKGTISVESEPQEFTRFVISIPFS